MHHGEDKFIMVWNPKVVSYSDSHAINEKSISLKARAESTVVHTVKRTENELSWNNVSGQEILSNCTILVLTEADYSCDASGIQIAL